VHRTEWVGQPLANRVLSSSRPPACTVHSQSTQANEQCQERKGNWGERGGGKRKSWQRQSEGEMGLRMRTLH
jgi:hypothetical protein